MTIELTSQQEKLLRYFYQYLCTFGAQPSLAEVAEHMGFAGRSGAHNHVKALVKKGYFTFDGHNARALVLLKIPNGEDFHGLYLRRAAKEKTGGQLPDDGRLGETGERPDGPAPGCPGAPEGQPPV